MSLNAAKERAQPAISSDSIGKARAAIGPFEFYLVSLGNSYMPTLRFKQKTAQHHNLDIG